MRSCLIRRGSRMRTQSAALPVGSTAPLPMRSCGDITCNWPSTTVLRRPKQSMPPKRSFQGFLPEFQNVSLNTLKELPIHSIRGSGYVLDTLVSSLWCLLHTDCFRSCVLQAVNLGEDTDTVGAVTGGLAGLYYGLDAIPKSGCPRSVVRKTSRRCVIASTRDYTNFQMLCGNFTMTTTYPLTGRKYYA